MKNDKPVVKPDYYDDFACIADRCTFSCCNDWTITVDEETCEKWKNLPLPDSMLFEHSEDSTLSTKRMIQCTKEEDDTRVICMKEDGHCPYLNKKGLCHIVLSYGDDCLAQTCRMFPREEHEYEDHIEQNLLPACETALKLLWERPRFQTVCQALTGNDGAPPGAAETAPAAGNDLIALREEIRALTDDSTKSVEQILKEGFVLAMKRAGYDIEVPAAYTPFEAQRERFAENNELFLDSMAGYREQGIYLPDIEPAILRAESYEELLARADYKKAGQRDLLKKLADFGAYYETLQPKLRLLFAEEIYATLAMPDGNYDTLLMKLEWLCLELAVLRHWYFLSYDAEGELPYERLVHLTSVLLRIMGFCDADIEEYLCECFESPIWEFDYLNLLL